jgi:hypothetical protein
MKNDFSDEEVFSKVRRCGWNKKEEGVQIRLHVNYSNKQEPRINKKGHVNLLPRNQSSTEYGRGYYQQRTDSSNRSIRKELGCLYISNKRVTQTQCKCICL